jgi:hypothetical protein
MVIGSIIVRVSGRILANVKSKITVMLLVVSLLRFTTRISIRVAGKIIVQVVSKNTCKGKR